MLKAARELVQTNLQEQLDENIAKINRNRFHMAALVKEQITLKRTRGILQKHINLLADPKKPRIIKGNTIVG